MVSGSRTRMLFGSPTFKQFSMKPCACSRQCLTYPRRAHSIPHCVPKNKKGGTVVIPCPKGTQINMSAIALHFNHKLVQHLCNTGTENEFIAKYWHDPKAFNPDRFLGNWNRDAFIPFSAGARSCIGRRYSIFSFTSRESKIMNTH